MRFRLAKKILRGLYREHIPYTIDQIDSAYRRIGKVYRYWDRYYCCNTYPKGDIPRLHSPIQQRILERLFDSEVGWGYDPYLAPSMPKTLPSIPVTAILVQQEVQIAPLTITFQGDDGTWTTTGTYEVRHNQEQGTLDFTAVQEPTDETR